MFMYELGVMVCIVWFSVLRVSEWLVSLVRVLCLVWCCSIVLVLSRWLLFSRICLCLLVSFLMSVAFMCLSFVVIYIVWVNWLWIVMMRIM